MSECLFPEVTEYHKDGMRQRILLLKGNGATMDEITALLRTSERDVRRLLKRPYYKVPDEGPLSGWKYESADLLEALKRFRAKDDAWKLFVGDYD